MKLQEDIVQVSKGGFAFCRVGVALLIWIGLLFQIKLLIWLSFFILLFSAILTVRYAPMILLWDYTFGFFIKTKKEYLSVKAMRFAHTLGTILAGVSLIFLYSSYEIIGWRIVAVFAVIKTISALGFCPASKLYTCMAKGGCCSLSKSMSKKIKYSCNGRC